MSGSRNGLNDANMVDTQRKLGELIGMVSSTVSEVANVRRVVEAQDDRITRMESNAAVNAAKIEVRVEGLTSAVAGQANTLAGAVGTITAVRDEVREISRKLQTYDEKMPQVANMMAGYNKAVAYLMVFGVVATMIWNVFGDWLKSHVLK